MQFVMHDGHASNDHASQDQSYAALNFADLDNTNSDPLWNLSLFAGTWKIWFEINGRIFKGIRKRA